MVSKLKPNLFIIGAAKCGTTSLAEMLSKIQDCYIPQEKECHFFDITSSYELGESYYQNYYKKAKKSHKYLIDATPSYILKNIYRDRINIFCKKNNVEPYFVIMVRDPVKRAFSHYLHQKRNAVEIKNFDSALLCEKKRLTRAPNSWYGYFNDGLYGAQLQNWLEVFDRSQVYIIKFEDFIQNPNNELKKLTDWLGVKKYEHIQPIKANVAGTYKSYFVARILTIKFPFREFFISLFGRERLRKVKINILELNRRDFDKNHNEKISKKTAAILKRKYQHDIQVFEKLSGLNCDKWKK